MSWLERILGTSPEPDNIESWNFPTDEALLENLAFTVVDVETTGLNVRKDTLLSIGAVRLENESIGLSDTFSEVVNSNKLPETSNVLIHQITPQMVEDGADRREALKRFLEFSAGTTLIAFHAGFDQAILTRAIKEQFSVTLKLPFHDLENWCQLLFAEQHHNVIRLDEWLDRFALHPEQRHSAVCDAMATAELMLICLRELRRRNITSWGEWDRMVTARQKLRALQVSN